MLGSLTTDLDPVANKNVLRNGLGSNIGSLQISTDGKNLDLALADMFPKMMITNIDVLGSGAELGKPGQLQCS